MDRDTIIDGLRMTMDLFTFDPSTGEEKDPDDLNDLDRATYDACKGALEILERLDTDSDTISRAKAIDAVKRLSLGETDAMRLAMRIGDYLERLSPAQLSTNLAEVGTDCISRQAAIDVIDSFNVFESRCDQIKLEQMIGKLPPAQPERIRGRWIPSDTDGFVCSVCRNGYRNQPTLMGKPMFEFCPVCGADMREVTT